MPPTTSASTRLTPAFPSVETALRSSWPSVAPAVATPSVTISTRDQARSFSRAAHSSARERSDAPSARRSRIVFFTFAPKPDTGPEYTSTIS